MITTEKQVLTAEVTVQAPVEKVWDLWTDPKHIVHWNNASDDWFTPHAVNDVRVGGKFLWRMEARDGSMGFDFEGEYTNIVEYQIIESVLGDGRKVKVEFWPEGTQNTRIIESFEAEDMNSLELQKQGWQAILNNFKRYAEISDKMEVMHFEIVINAPIDKVYKNMLDAGLWNEWTAAFNPSSSFEGNWEKGSTMRFIGCDENGIEGGMVSRIRENIPNRFLSIEHLGILKDGQEITTGPEVEGWAGALENYFYKEVNGATQVIVEVDTNHEFKSFFEDTWPKALNKLKEICER